MNNFYLYSLFLILFRCVSIFGQDEAEQACLKICKTDSFIHPDEEV